LRCGGSCQPFCSHKRHVNVKVRLSTVCSCCELFARADAPIKKCAGRGGGGEGG
jgi:hypothetical protein